MTQEKAVKDDPTIYQYDEIYDNIKEKKSNEKLKNKDKNPKYIESLLKSAHKRKLENERRIERQVKYIEYQEYHMKYIIYSTIDIKYYKTSVYDFLT